MVGSGDEAQIVVFRPGENPLVADSSHPSFRAIVEAAFDGDESIASYFDVTKAVIEKFTRLSRRVTTANGRLFLDGDELHGTIVEHILALYSAGASDFQSVVNFLELTKQNPNPKSVEQLYEWLNASEGFTLDPDGYIRGYKGVQRLADGSLVSVRAGKAIVNGEPKSGQIPNELGDVVEMPRTEVTFDPAVGCSYGLRVGTFDYASNWAQGALLEVRVNPSDVVSVPTDCSAQKMRTCRYEVVATIDQKYATPLVGLDTNGLEDLWGDGEGDDPEGDLWFDFLND